MFPSGGDIGDGPRCFFAGIMFNLQSLEDSKNRRQFPCSQFQASFQLALSPKTFSLSRLCPEPHPQSLFRLSPWLCAASVSISLTCKAPPVSAPALAFAISIPQENLSSLLQPWSNKNAALELILGGGSVILMPLYSPLSLFPSRDPWGHTLRSTLPNTGQSSSWLPSRIA